MRDRIVFFILGALLATIAYFAGNIENLDADNEIKEILECDTLIVRDRIIVTIGDDIQRESFIHISVVGGRPTIHMVNNIEGYDTSSIHLIAREKTEQVPPHSAITLSGKQSKNFWQLTSFEPLDD